MSTNTAIDVTQSINASDRQLLLDLIFSNNNPLIVEALRQADFRIRRSVSEPMLRAYIEDLLDNNQLTLADLVNILNTIEGWGRQQVYLYRFEGGETIRQQWLDISWIRDHFSQLGKENLLNQTRPVVMPDNPTLVSIEHDASTNRIRFVWLQKRTAYKRSENDDPPPDRFPQIRDSALERIVYRAYREIMVRGVMSFDWNIQTNEAMLMIYKLAGTNYAQVRDERIAELGSFLPMKDFRSLPISAIVTKLENSEEVVRRELAFQSVNNEGKLVVSSGNQDDVFADKVLEQARRQIIDDVTGLSGLIRWRKKTSDRKLMTLELYGRNPDDQRIGIGAQELEEDVRHVLQRIRTYCL